MSPVNGKGGLGWVILVVALAVPGVLFYNWWSHLKADREKAVAAKARGRVPEGGVFESSPNAKLVNPMAPVPSTAAPAGAAAALASTAPASSAVPPASAATIAPPPAAATATETSPAAAAAPAVSSGAVQAPPLKRDPTLSPFDQVRILEEEQARLAAEEALRNLKNPAKTKKVVKAYDPKKDVDLQGIVSTPDGGFKAIVNNDVVGVGEKVGKGIRIVRITDQGVVFEYQGKKFSKSVNRDE